MRDTTGLIRYRGYCEEDSSDHRVGYQASPYGDYVDADDALAYIAERDAEITLRDRVIAKDRDMIAALREESIAQDIDRSNMRAELARLQPLAEVGELTMEWYEEALSVGRENVESSLPLWTAINALRSVQASEAKEG